MTAVLGPYSLPIQKTPLLSSSIFFSDTNGSASWNPIGKVAAVATFDGSWFLNTGDSGSVEHWLQRFSHLQAFLLKKNEDIT